ncbi:MAG: Secretion system C-terminal sorting domain, partial [Bacteroidota bacterium]
GDPYYLPFEDPYDLQTDELYFTCILNENESDGEITVLANANTDSDNSTAVYEIAGDGTFVWFGSQTWTPAVRLIISEWTGVEELNTATGLNSFMINPNPAVDIARLNFNLNQNSVIAYEVRDMSGKLVDWKNVGRFVEGNQVIDLNVAGYAAGNYNVSLVVNGAHMVTRQMSVVK